MMIARRGACPQVRAFDIRSSKQTITVVAGFRAVFKRVVRFLLFIRCQIVDRNEEAGQATRNPL